MAYLGQSDEEIFGPSSSTSSGGMSAEESQALATAFQQFTNGDMLGAAGTLGPEALQAAGLIPAGVVPVVGAAIGVGLTLAAKYIGAGRREADIIVPVQNQISNPQGTGQLDQLTQILVRNPNVAGLQAMYQDVINIATAFMQFISSPRFTDGRASQQAADTIFPFINGTCGYAWPPPMKPSRTGCLTWGDGTPGGPGTDGMLGAISRAILRQGGQLPPPLPTQTAGPYQQLQYSGSQNFPYIPQAGTLPANAPLSPLRASSVPVVQAGMDIVPMLLLVGAAFYALPRILK